MLKRKSKLPKISKNKISINRNTTITMHPMKGSAKVSYQLNRKIHPSINIKNVNMEANVQGRIKPSATIEHTKRNLVFQVSKTFTQRSQIKIFRQLQTNVRSHKRILSSGKTVKVRKHRRRTLRKLF